MLEGSSLTSSGGTSLEDSVFVELAEESGLAQRLARVEDHLSTVEASLVSLRDERKSSEDMEKKYNIWSSTIDERLRVSGMYHLLACH